MSRTVAPAVPSMAHPMALLRSGVPLTLLLDLAFGPHTGDLLAHERAGRGDDAVPQPERTSRS